MVRFFSALGAPLLAFVQYLGELVPAGCWIRFVPFSPQASMEIVSQPGCRSGIAFAARRHNHRRVHWCGVLGTNIFPI